MQEKHHLCIDGYDADIVALRNEDLLSSYFKKIDVSAHTHILYFPDDSHKGMEGVTGCLLAPGLHTTVHTYTNAQKKCYFLDFFGFEENDHRKYLLDLKKSYEGTYQMEHEITRSLQDIPYGVPSASNIRVYGPHLMAEFTIAEGGKEEIAAEIKKFLQDLPEVIDMHTLTEVFQVESEEWVSALRVIAESHISIHYHPATHVLFLDIFSCKPFEWEKAKDLLMQHFDVKTYQQRIWERGVYFQHS